MLAQFSQNMAAATFSFVMDGQTDMMSLNPLEHTNFEMMGMIFGIGGVVFTFLMGRMARRKALADSFNACQTEDDAIEQYP
jgi:hypothetical protein